MGDVVGKNRRSKRENLTIGDDDSASEQPAVKIKKIGEESVPPPEIIELQQKVAKLEQENAELEDNLQRTCQATRQAEARAELAENQLELIRGSKEDTEEEKEEENSLATEVGTRLTELVTQLESALKCKQAAVSHNRELERENDVLKGEVADLYRLVGISNWRMKRAAQRNRSSKREVITIDDDDSSSEQPAVKSEKREPQANLDLSSSANADVSQANLTVPYRDDLMKKTLRERVVHIAVTARYKSFDEVIARLRRDGLPSDQDSRKNIESILKEVSEPSESGRVCLKPCYFSQVNLKWKWFTTEEFNYIRKLHNPVSPQEVATQKQKAVQPVPPPEVIELQQKVAKLEQENAKLEDNFQRACRAARQAELRADFAESQLDSKRGIVDGVEKEQEKEKRLSDAFEEKLTHLSTQLEQALKREEDAYSHNREVIREKDAVMNANRELHAKVNFLAHQLDAERMRGTQDRARNDELTCRLAKYEGWPHQQQQQHQPYQMMHQPLQMQQPPPPLLPPPPMRSQLPPPPPPPMMQPQLQLIQMHHMQLHEPAQPPQFCPNFDFMRSVPPPLVKIVKICDAVEESAQPTQQPSSAATSEISAATTASDADSTEHVKWRLLQLDPRE